MSVSNLVSASNLIFLLGGIYLAALAGLHETTIYILIPAVVCFVAFGLGMQPEGIFSSPWRTATAVMVIVLLVVQEAADLSLGSTDYYSLISVLINGAFLILFLGLLLATLKDVVGKEREEEESVESKAVSR